MQYILNGRNFGTLCVVQSFFVSRWLDSDFAVSEKVQVKSFLVTSLWFKVDKEEW